MKIRAQTVVAGLAGKATPMNNVGAKGFYIQSVGGRWWVKKGGAILANLPYTIESPHPGQAEWRVKFGAVASETAGLPLKERFDIIRAALKGKTAKLRMNPEDYPSKKKGFHDIATLESMLRSKVSEAAYNQVMGEVGELRALAERLKHGRVSRGPSKAALEALGTVF